MIQDFKIKTATSIRCLKEELKDYKNRINSSIYDEKVKSISDEIRQNGFCVLKNYYDFEKCSQLRLEIDTLVEKYKDLIWIDPQNSDHRLFGAERVSLLVKEFHEDSFLMDVADCYTKTKNINNFTLAAKLIATENNIGSGGGWHRDSEFEKQFKAIIYLSDVDTNNGPFQYIAKTNSIKSVVDTAGIESKKRFTEEDIDEVSKIFKQPIDSLTGNAGDLLLVDTRGIHRGKPIVSGTRYALFNYYSATHRKEQFLSYFKDLLNLPKVY